MSFLPAVHRAINNRQPNDPVRRGDWRKKGGRGCHGRHDCHKEIAEVFLPNKEWPEIFRKFPLLKV